MCQSIAAGLLALLLAPAAQAEDAFCDDGCEYETQWFEPVDFDFNCRPMRKSCGYFFNYDKLTWNMSGETITIGKKGLVVQSENIFGTSPNSAGTTPQSYAIINGIQDAQPNAEFGTGDRYEFGHFSGDHGWLVGVLDGPKVTTSENYGFQGIILPNSLPLSERIFNPLNMNFNPDILPETLTEALANALSGSSLLGSADLSTSRNGFGSVHVNFETPADYLLGFRDYATNGADNELGPTVGGPGRRLTAVAFTTTIDTDQNGDQQVQVQLSSGTITTGADGITDDLDGDTLPGFFVTGIDTDGDGTIDVITGTGVDYDDLHLYNVRFDSVFVKNVTETQGVEIMKTYDLSNRHLPVKDQNQRIQIAGGVRFLSLRDQFYFEGRGDVLGRTYADTRAQNQIVGPQLRARWSKQLRSRWFMNLDGRFMFGYNIQNQKQDGAVGEDLVPGGLNSLVNAQPNAFAYSRTKNSFSPVAEFRAEGGYQLTSAIALKLGYTATYIDNITRASQTVRWYLPDMGLLEGGNQGIFINGVNFGLELIH
ncbi:MAG: BBP7 family outer membrane beta-barrel protein [Pirellulales bacterium]